MRLLSQRLWIKRNSILSARPPLNDLLHTFPETRVNYLKKKNKKVEINLNQIFFLFLTWWVKGKTINLNIKRIARAASSSFTVTRDNKDVGFLIHFGISSNLLLWLSFLFLFSHFLPWSISILLLTPNWVFARVANL